MKVKPALAASFILSGMLFITALYSLLLQPDPEGMALFWQAGLAADMILIIGSYLFSRAASLKTVPFLALDAVICSAVLYLVYSGIIHAGLTIRRPLGMGASFDYTFFLPLLFLVCSLLCIKDALNIIYGYSARGREALVFLTVRMSAILSLLLLGGILLVIVYKGIWVINWEFLTQPHRRLGQAGGISTAIMGSFWMVIGAMIVSSPLGIGAAIYLHEYSRSQRLNRLITIAVSCLNGVPSVVFGLFGLAFLVRFFGVSLLIRLHHPGADQYSHHHPHLPGGLEERSQFFAGGEHGSGSHQVADHQKGGFALVYARDSHRRDHGGGQGQRRDGAHHVDGGDIHRHPGAYDLRHHTRLIPAGQQPGLSSPEPDLLPGGMGCGGQGLGNGSGAHSRGAGDKYAGHCGAKSLSKEDILVDAKGRINPPCIFAYFYAFSRCWRLELLAEKANS